VIQEDLQKYKHWFLTQNPEREIVPAICHFAKNEFRGLPFFHFNGRFSGTKTNATKEQ